MSGVTIITIVSVLVILVICDRVMEHYNKGG